MANVFEFCSSLIAASRVTEADESLSEAKNAKKKQNLMSGKADNDTGDEDDCLKKNKGVEDDVVASVRENLVCNICFCMSEKPVTVVHSLSGSGFYRFVQSIDYISVSYAF